MLQHQGEISSVINFFFYKGTYLIIGWCDNKVSLNYHLQDNVLLKTFNISMNGISNGGAFAFGEALKHNRSLLEADLSYNRIHDEGIEKLVKGFKANDTLRVLKVFLCLVCFCREIPDGIVIVIIF